MCMAYAQQFILIMCFIKEMQNDIYFDKIEE